MAFSFVWSCCNASESFDDVPEWKIIGKPVVDSESKNPGMWAMLSQHANTSRERVASECASEASTTVLSVYASVSDDISSTIEDDRSEADIEMTADEMAIVDWMKSLTKSPQGLQLQYENVSETSTTTEDDRSEADIELTADEIAIVDWMESLDNNPKGLIHL
mmetsp:Transcript_107953/g.168744  ORF Transcript_107953/g.168744 Transcript_107953/m.168744 type:complete len:163 (-) Transcript_107953:476-964(-)